MEERFNKASIGCGMIVEKKKDGSRVESILPHKRIMHLLPRQRREENSLNIRTKVRDLQVSVLICQR